MHLWSGWRRWLAAVLGSAALFGVVALAVLHTPPVRARILASIASRLTAAGLVVQADQLDYSLARLDVRLRNLKLAASHRPSEPFLTAEEVHAVFGWRVLVGRIDVDVLEAARPRIVLTRNADSLINLPAAATPDSRSPGGRNRALPEIAFHRVRIAHLDVVWRDAVTGSEVDASDLSIELNPSGSAASGPLHLARPARVRWNNRSEELSSLDGRLSWNGRDLSAESLRAAFHAGRVQIDGRIHSLTSDPRVDLRIVADAELAALAPWLSSTRQPMAGALHLQANVATASGAAAPFEAAIAASGRDLALGGFHGMQLEASARIQQRTADLTMIRLQAAGGSIAGHGRMSLDAASGAVEIEWKEIDLGRVMEAAAGSNLPVLPSAAAAGSLTAAWTAPRLDAFRVRSESRLAPLGANAAAAGNRRPTRGRLPLEGPFALQIDRGRLAIRAEPAVGENPDRSGDAGHAGSDQRARATIEIAGTLDEDDVLRSPIGGAIRLNASSLGDIGRELTHAGIGGAHALQAGTARGDFSLAGTLGDPHIDGTLDAQGVRFRTRDGDGVRVSTFDADRVHARVSATSSEVDLPAIDVVAGASRMHADGRVRLASRTLDGRFDATVGDVDELARAVPLPVNAGGALDARGTVAGSFDVPRLAATITSRNLVVAGQHVDRLVTDLRLIGRDVELDRLCLSANDDRAGGVDRHADCQLEARGRIDLARETYAVHAAADGLPIRPATDADGRVIVPLTAALTATLDGDGSFKRLGGSGRLALSGARWNELDIGRVEADLIAAGTRVSLDVQAPDLAIAGTGEAGVDPHSAFAVHARWEPADFAELARRLAWSPPFPLSGSTSIQIDAGGTRDDLKNLHVVAAVDRLHADADQQPIDLARPARLEYDGRVARVRDVTLTSGSSTLTIDGSLGDRSQPGLTAQLRGLLSDFAFVQRLYQPGNPAAALTGAVDLRLDASGSLEHPDLSGSIRVTDGSVPVIKDLAFSGTVLTANYSTGVLTIDQLRAAFQGAAVEASGRIPAGLFRNQLPPRWSDLIPTAAGPARLNARVTSITEQVAAPFADASTLEQLRGHIDASIALQADDGTLESLNGAVTLDRAELSVSGVSFDQQAPTRLIVRGGRLEVASWEWGRGDNRVVLAGGLRLGNNQALDLTARTSLDLRLLTPFTGMARPAGRADAEIRIGGTTADPTVDGFVTFAGGELRLADPRVVISDLSGTVTLARDTITLERIWASMNGGDAEISGTVHHRWFTPGGGSISVRARHAAFDLSGLQAEADTDLTLAIEPRGQLLSGTVTLVRSTYREPLSLTGGLLQALRSPTPGAAPGAPSPLDNVRLDVHVVTGSNLLVDNNYARLAASADLRVGGTVAQPAPTGSLTLAEGGVIFFGGNQYRLEGQNSIDFTNPALLEPDLNLTAVRRVSSSDGQVEIKLELKGTPATFETAVKSDTHPHLSQADLASLLVTGRKLEDTGTYTPGAEDLLGLVSGELFGTAARAVGLDVIRVERGSPNIRFDAELVATETDPGARLTFGKNIGPRTEVVFSQSLRESGGLTWVVSHAPRAHIAVSAVSLDNRDRLYDFRHELLFGQPPRPNTAPVAAPSRVGAVSISGAGADEHALRSLLRLKPGDRFSFFRWQDDRERLEQFYRERDRAEARVITRRSEGAGTSGEDTVTDITYDVRPGPHTTIVIDGFAFPRRVIDSIATAWSRAVIDEFLIDEVQAIVRGDLVDRGFVEAAVSATVAAAGEEKQLRVRVERGRQVRQRRVVFEGNGSIPSERLRERIRSAGLDRAVWLDPDRVRDALTAFYRGEGYLNASARIDPVTIQPAAAIRTIHLSEGEPFHIREVRLEGVRALSAPDVVKASALGEGETFSDPVIDRARRGIAGAYRAEGFNSMTVTLRTERVEGRPEVDVRITIEEGPQQRLREIVTTGLARTPPELVARELKLEPGQPVNLAAWSSARRRLYETGVFRSIAIQPEPDATVGASGGAEQPVRARITLEEWPAVRVRYGLEVQDQHAAADDPSRAQLPEPAADTGRNFGIGAASDVTVRNLFGRGLSAGAAGRYTRDFRAGRTFLTARSLFGLPLTSNVYFSQSHEQLGESGTESGVAKFAVDLTDITLEQRVKPIRPLEISYGYTFEHNHTFDLHPPPDELLPFDVPVSVARLQSTVLFDNRNDLVDATRGWFHSSHVEYGPTSLGSDRRFIKYLLQQRYYRASGAVVLAGSASLGLASAFGESLLPSERFFAGGGNSVRGYAEHVLSPRDRFDALVGGGALVVLSGEARFPIYKIIRGVGFVDAGRAFDTVKNLRLTDLSAGTGAGLRVQTPVVLLRLDFGVPLDGSVGPRRGRWFFSIGQAF